MDALLQWTLYYSGCLITVDAIVDALLPDASGPYALL